jgi:hypothetical protein
MLWWHWMLLGLVLLGVEMLVPGGLFALFFGIAAVLVGILVSAGVSEPSWVPWFLFSLLSIVSLLLCRGPLLSRLQFRASTSPLSAPLLHEIVTLLEDLPPGAVGKAELRGTVWNVHNASPGGLQKGQRCPVQRVDGLTLFINGEGNMDH